MGPFKILIVVPFALSLIASTQSQKLPDGFPRCKPAQPDFSDCLTKAMQTAVLKMKDGLKDFHIEPISPLFIEKMDFVISSPFVIVDTPTQLANVTMHGLDKIKFLNTSSEFPKKCGLSSYATAPEIKIFADYTTALRITTVPVFSGNGTANVTMNDARLEFIVDCENVKRGASDFLLVTDFKLDIVPANSTISFSPGSGDVVVLQEQATRLILKALKPHIISYVSSAFHTIANKVFLNVPINAVFQP